MKSFFRSAIVTALLGRLIWAWMQILRFTMRWTVEGEAEASAAWKDAPGVVIAAWHNTILLMPTGHKKHMVKWPGRDKETAMLISLSPDGESVAQACARLGLTLIRGSAANKKKANKNKGGAKAIAQAVRHLKANGAVCITPDGPRGPSEEVSLGAIMIAQRAGASIMPFALAAKPAKRLGSWDRFILAFPFTRGAIVYGEMLATSREDTPEDLQAELQRRLRNATARAQEIVGAAQSQPAMSDAAS